MDDSKWNEAIRELDSKNYEHARVLLQPLSKNKEAQLQLGYLYQEGLGGEANPEKAREIFQGLADENDPQGTYFLAKSFLNSQHLTEAVSYFEKSAQLSHVSGAFWAAALHGGLYGHPRDDQKYRFFLEWAASLGHIYAKRDLALEDIKDAKSFLASVNARLRYASLMAVGIAMTLRNRNDFRLR